MCEQLARQKPDHPDERRRKEHRNDAQPERAPPEDEGREHIGQHGERAVVGIRIEHAAVGNARAELDDVLDLHERVHLVLREIGVDRIARLDVLLRVQKVCKPFVAALRMEGIAERDPLRVGHQLAHVRLVHIRGDNVPVRIHEHDFVDEHGAGKFELHQPARGRERSRILVTQLHPVVVGAERFRIRRIEIRDLFRPEPVRRDPAQRGVGRGAHRDRKGGAGLRVRRARVEIHLAQRGAVLIVEVEGDGAPLLREVGAAAPVEPADRARAHDKEGEHEEECRLGEFRIAGPQLFQLVPLRLPDNSHLFPSVLYGGSLEAAVYFIIPQIGRTVKRFSKLFAERAKNMRAGGGKKHARKSARGGKAKNLTEFLRCDNEELTIGAYTVSVETRREPRL